MDLMGWIGSLLLAGCGLPEAILAIKNKRTGLSWPFLIMWGLGEIFVLIPVLFKVKTPWLIINYTFNTILIGVIVYVKFRGEGFNVFNKEKNGL